MNWKKILIGEWSWSRPFKSLAVIYLSLLAFALFAADSLIFHPPGTEYSNDEDHFIILDDGKGSTVAAYYRPALDGMTTILWSHGNAENLATVKHAMDGLNEMGFGVLAYDYPGYGNSSGKPSEDGCQKAIALAYQHLIDDEKIPAAKIILAGQSVGSGPTCWLAENKDHGALLLISPFLSAFRTVTRIPVFPGDRFPNLHRIENISTPLLVIHGEKDEVIPFVDGKKLFELSPSEQKTFLPIPGAGHNNLYAIEPIPIFNAIQTLGQEITTK
ncbi:alpha/beta fold hydrolase [Verrucomicrobiaceae bacterium 227]